MSGIKSRAYSVTVNRGHGDYQTHLNEVGRLYADGSVDYAVYCAETDRSGRAHLQGFVIFNEGALEDKKKPTDYLSGHWAKSRSLTGSHDYCTREGIHYRKEGFIAAFECGKWVDAGYNINIKFRKQYQFAEMLQDGFRPDDILKEDPAGVMLVGFKQLKEVWVGLGTMPSKKKMIRPYCYIGPEQWDAVLTYAFAQESFQEEE